MVTDADLHLVRQDLIRWALIESDYAMLTGSRAEGLGNEHSDYDIYMFVVDAERAFDAKRTSLIDGYLYIQYECFSFDDALALAQKVNKFDQNDNDNALAALTLGELDRYYRTSIGLSVTSRESSLSVLSLYRKETAIRVFESWAKLQGRNQMKYTRQLQAMGRFDRAFLAARSCLEWAVDSWLAQNGEGFTSRKWRFEKLSRIVERSSDMYIRLWKLKNLGALTPLEYIDEALDLAQELGVHSGDSNSLLGIVPTAKSDVGAFMVRSQPYLIKNRSRLFAVTPTTFQIWSTIASGQWDKDNAVALIAENSNVSLELAPMSLHRILDDLETMEMINWLG